MPNISKPYPMTPQERTEVMRKQIEREYEREERWNAEMERRVAAEKERSKWDCSNFPRGPRQTMS